MAFSGNSSMYSTIRFFTLRRKDPASQPQIREVDYRLPNRGFQD